MGKLLAWLLVFVVFYLGMRLFVILKRKSAAAGERRARANADRPAAAGKPVADREASAEPMQPCAHCGVYVPVSEMLQRGARRYCCAEHRDADR